MNINEIVDTFDLLGEWEERYRYLIDLGNQMPPMPDSLKTEGNRVQGCMSQVWMVLRFVEGRLEMIADSDAQIVRGLIALLHAVYHGKPVEEIAALDIEGIFIRLGLEGHLSPNRRNGFFSMVEKIRAFTGRNT